MQVLSRLSAAACLSGCPCHFPHPHPPTSHSHFIISCFLHPCVLHTCPCFPSQTCGTCTLTPACTLSGVCHSHTHTLAPAPNTAGLQCKGRAQRGRGGRQPLKLITSSCPSSCAGAQLSPWTGLGSQIQGLSGVVAAQRAGEGVGDRGIRNLNACLFSIPCAVNLSK